MSAVIPMMNQASYHVSIPQKSFYTTPVKHLNHPIHDAHRLTGAGICVVEMYNNVHKLPGMKQLTPCFVLLEENGQLSNAGGKVESVDIQLYPNPALYSLKTMITEAAEELGVDLTSQAQVILDNCPKYDISGQKSEQLTYRVAVIRIDGLSDTNFRQMMAQRHQQNLPHKWLEMDSLTHVPITNVLAMNSNKVTDIRGKHWILTERTMKELRMIIADQAYKRYGL